MGSFATHRTTPHCLKLPEVAGFRRARTSSPLGPDKLAAEASCSVDKPRSLAALHRDESGVSYYVSVVMLLPFYILMVVCAIELALLLNAKMAVNHAAYAAARSAIVWIDAREIPEDVRMGMIYAAAASALAPVASGSSQHQQPSSSYFAFPAKAATEWAEGYRHFSGAQQEVPYLTRKYDYAARAIRIRVTRQSSEFNSPLTIELEYEHPFHTSGAGRVFGHVASWLARPLRSTTICAKVTMETEGFRPPDASSTTPVESMTIPFHANFGFRAVSW